MTASLEIKPSGSPIQRYDATWQDYVAVRDSDDISWQKIAFNQGWLWFDMGKEGPNHAAYSDFITIIFGFWAFLYPEESVQSYGRCLIEKVNTQACAPDLVLYKGENIPKLQPGERRKIDLSHHRLPDLVGEIADTSLSLDLDEQKRLYASLGIPEYWVIDVRGQRLFIFMLADTRQYEPVEQSSVLAGISVELVEQALIRLDSETNTAAANWLMQQLQK
ncbi:MAG: Uma2 family endonuclease [Cyanobacteria bacterium J06648_16]